MPPAQPELEIRERGDGIELDVKVVPGASRTRLSGRWGHALKVAVAAPPEGGKANAALVRVLAEALGVRAADVHLVRGHGSPLKRVAVAGINAAEARRRLG